MELTLIIGPMKSGKSFDLINHFAPLRFTTIPFALFQSARNVRDLHIHSRNGANLEAQKIHSLKDIGSQTYSVVGIDEIHMFPEEDYQVVEWLLRQGTNVVISGLDTDYRGKLFPIVQRLLELGPKEVRYKRAVCDTCQRFNATHTQVLLDTVAITSGMPSVIPDDGTYAYKAACRGCFVRT